MAEGSTSPDYESFERELERYKKRCSELEKQVDTLASENKELREKLASLDTTVSAVVARSIDAKADTGRSRWKKVGRKRGHEGPSRTRPEYVDSTVEVDQSTICHRCGGILSRRSPPDSYTMSVNRLGLCSTRSNYLHPQRLESQSVHHRGVGSHLFLAHSFPWIRRNTRQDRFLHEKRMRGN